jgi:predicted transcriptional regulator
LDEDKRKLIEERCLPEDEGVLHSKTISINIDGSIQKDIKVPFCDFCGAMLKEERLALCSFCKRKICSSCAIIHENKTYCRECAKEILSLTKENFIVLYGVANEVNLKNIREFSFISSENLRQSLSTLLERGLIETEGLSIFAHYIITNKGLAVLPTCEQIYRNEGDVSRFLLRLQEFLSEA